MTSLTKNQQPPTKNLFSPFFFACHSIKQTVLNRYDQLDTPSRLRPPKRQV